ncbi:unnamed protein product [Heterobilharzia americana]|nr:unnamed protein product [Heterobilharzia americana]CAH8500146.1 unnamed protein product [Heterobilharzia americana]
MDSGDLRKLIEDQANQTIESIQGHRDISRKKLAEYKRYVIEQVSTLFTDLESRCLKQENESDDFIQELIVELMELLKNIDTLLIEIHTCKSTLSKLNNMLTGKENFS